MSKLWMYKICSAYALLGAFFNNNFFLDIKGISSINNLSEFLITKLKYYIGRVKMLLVDLLSLIHFLQI